MNSKGISDTTNGYLPFIAILNPESAMLNFIQHLLRPEVLILSYLVLTQYSKSFYKSTLLIITIRNNFLLLLSKTFNFSIYSSIWKVWVGCFK